MLYDAKECCLHLQGATINYITFGKGTRPLVMIQGLNTRSIHGMAVPLAFMYRIFAKDYKVYLFDRREDVWEGITVRDLAADIAMAMDALEIRNADIIGVSQGGMIAQYLAVDRPELVRRLVLAVTLSKNNPIVENVIETWINMVEQGDMRALVSDMAVRMYSEVYLKRYQPFIPLLAVVQKPKDVARFIALAKACLTCNVYDELGKIKCPVFVIGGRKDKVVGGDASEEIAEKMGCRIYMYDNYGHAVYEEARDFNRRVFDFLKE